MGWADAFKQPVASPEDGRLTVEPRTAYPTQPVTDNGLSGGTPAGDPWEQQLEATLRQRYGNDEATIQRELQYYKAKRTSGELSGRVGAGEFPSMDAYWLHRATGTDPQDQPGGGGAGFGGAPPGFSLGGVNGLASFQAPGLLAPFTEQFQKPDPANMLASPSYQWTLGRTLDAVNKGHGAGGTFNTGGRLKDLMDYAGGVASQEYDKDWNRNLNLYGMNRDTFWGNQGNAFNKLNTTTNMGLSAANNYAGNVSGIYENMANANAGQRQVQGENTSNLVGGAVNTGLGALFDWLGTRRRG